MGVGFVFDSYEENNNEEDFPFSRRPFVAAAAVISLAGGAAGFAAELPTYQAAGLPISAVQVRVLGAANVEEQSPVPASAVSPHQLNVLRSRTKMTTATVAPTRTETARAIR